jgi:hypothetical protein
MPSAVALIAAAMSSMFRSGKRTARGVMLEKEEGEWRMEVGRRGTAREGLTVHLQKMGSERHRQPLQQALACAAVWSGSSSGGPGASMRGQQREEGVFKNGVWGGAGLMSKLRPGSDDIGESARTAEFSRAVEQA